MVLAYDAARVPGVEELDDHLAGMGGRDDFVDQVTGRGAVGQGVPLPLFEQFFAAELAMRREVSAVFEDIERLLGIT